MSKKSLKKELDKMSREQLEEMILQAYESRKDFREYLEYFVNPNPAKLFEKSLAQLAKECQRGNRGRSKARITVIRKVISDFKSYEPGDEDVCRLMLAAIEIMFTSSRKFKMTDTLERGFVRLVNECIDMADRAGCLTPVLEALHGFTESSKGAYWCRSLIHKTLVAEKGFE